MKIMVDDPRAAKLISRLEAIHPNVTKSIQETTCGPDGVQPILILSSDKFPEQHDQRISYEIMDCLSSEETNPDSWLSGFGYEFGLDVSFWWNL